MKMLLLTALALPDAALAQSAPPPGVSWQERPAAATPPPPLPTRPAQVRRTEALPPITPAPPEVEAMLAPEYIPPAPPPVPDVPADAEYRAVRPGDRVNGAWQHPFYALDAARHGLPEPPAGARWIRLVDGALLVEADGRVLDTRWDLAQPVAAIPAQDHLGDVAAEDLDDRAAVPVPTYASPATPAMIVIETTTTTSGGPSPRL